MDYVFGYASLVALREPLVVEGVERAPLPGRLRGFRRHWGVAMDNRDPVNDRKHFLDAESGERPLVRVAYLDIAPAAGGGGVNGLALPVDAARLAELDEREVNYERIEVSGIFEPDSPEGFGAGDDPVAVYTYRGGYPGRHRCRVPPIVGDTVVSREYVAAVRDAFAALGPRHLAELERSTHPLPFPERDLVLARTSEGA